MNEILLIIKVSVIIFVTFIMIQLIIRHASVMGLVDIPNHRSSHNKITPRGAGIGIILGVISSDIFLWNQIVFTHFFTFLAIFFVFVVGALDDHRDTEAKTKFYVIFIAVLFLAYDGAIIHTLGKFFGREFTLGFFSIPFTIFAVAGFTNALNLSDGLDGLAGLLSIIILSTLCFIGYEKQDLFIFVTALSFISAVIVFLWFNWSPAKIFMGDSGSLTLGFVISVLSIKALEYMNPVSILFIAAIPILDTLIVIIRRKQTGRPIFSADKLHMHHILLRFFNGNIRKTVIFIALLQLGFSIIGVNFSESTNQQYMITLFLISIITFYLLLNGMIERKNKFTLYRKKRRK